MNPKKLTDFQRKIICVSLQIVMAAVFTFSAQAQAGTFVGNGGSAQDLDLDGALAIINKGSKTISEESETLCSCSERWENNPLCIALSQLSEAEKKSCREILVNYASEIEELSRRDSKIKFGWTDSPMTAKGRDDDSRKVDAVSQVEKRTIIINRQRFSDMKLMYRTALLTHELFHFIKINGKYIDDTAPAAPFKNGRAMLDTLGAALTMESFENENFSKIIDLELVSRSKRRYWIYLEANKVSHQKKASKNLLRAPSSHGVSLAYARRADRAGFSIGIDSITHRSSFAKSIDVKEDIGLIGFGANYKLSLFDAYLSNLNESHFILGVTGLLGSAQYSASSDGTMLKDSGSALALKTSVKGLYPLNNGFWFSAGMEARYIRYEYKKLQIKTSETQSVFTIGGAYGF